MVVSIKYRRAQHTVRTIPHQGELPDHTVAIAAIIINTEKNTITTPRLRREKSWIRGGGKKIYHTAVYMCVETTHTHIHAL